MEFPIHQFHSLGHANMPHRRDVMAFLQNLLAQGPRNHNLLLISFFHCHETCWSEEHFLMRSSLAQLLVCCLVALVFCVGLPPYLYIFGSRLQCCSAQCKNLFFSLGLCLGLDDSGFLSDASLTLTQSIGNYIRFPGLVLDCGAYRLKQPQA